MTRWARGEVVVERLLGDGMLQQVHGAEASGQPWLDRAGRTLTAAASLADVEPASACTLAYDAARFACMALIAHQGLRPTTRGGHVAVEETVRAQFGDAFKPFRDLRLRRNELEYPTHPDEPVDAHEATESVAAARAILAAASQLLPHLRIF
jgi:HEPN domain-containing protein